MRPPPRSPLFPSPPLFRSRRPLEQDGAAGGGGEGTGGGEPVRRRLRPRQPLVLAVVGREHRRRLREPRNVGAEGGQGVAVDRKSTRLNSSHANISYAVFCL